MTLSNGVTLISAGSRLRWARNQQVQPVWSYAAEWQIPAFNHFTIIDELTREDSALFSLVADGLR
jgi:hypothetical protein